MEILLIAETDFTWDGDQIKKKTNSNDRDLIIEDYKFKIHRLQDQTIKELYNSIFEQDRLK